MNAPASPPCPCGRRDAAGRALSLAQCCGPHLGDFEGTPAPDAESLMRSRYSAYVLGRSPYLMATWHASTRPAQAGRDAGTRWLGLEVRSHRRTGDDRAEVEFIARSRPPGSGPALRQHERSRFVREDGRWYYVDGDWL